MNQRIRVATAGVAFVAVYATIQALESLVFDPLAAVPGRSLGQIHAHLLKDGMDVSSDIVSVIVIAAIGVALAVGAALVGLRKRLAFLDMSLPFLRIIALGAVMTFGNGFALGMDVADAYGIGGEDHTIWAGILYATSFMAFLVLAAIALARLVRARRGPLTLRS